jgi:hypothetical protein
MPKIKLTESQLKNLVEKCVKRALNEISDTGKAKNNPMFSFNESKKSNKLKKQIKVKQ